MDSLRSSPALQWEWEGPAVRCLLCPHRCLLSPGKAGRCGVRRHEVGRGLVTLNDGGCAAVAVDPMEKKPLFHFRPGSLVLSLGTVGCNMRCPFCQNWPLARAMDPPGGDPPSNRRRPIALELLTPQGVRDEARRLRVSSVAFTYNEPVVWFEFLRRTLPVLKEAGLATLLVTNGMINPGPLEELIPFLDGANVDVKAFDGGVYRDTLGGDLTTVCATVEALRRARIHVELTFLLVPNLNDDRESFGRMLRWISSLPGPIPPPLHLSRSFPQYRWRGPSPTMEELRDFLEEARRILPFVYLGNTDEPEVTKCRRCGRDIVTRRRYTIFHNSLDTSGNCGYCGEDNGMVL